MKCRTLAIFACTISCLSAETATDCAIRLYDTGRITEAESALQKIVAADPGNSAAFFYLGMAFRYGNGGHTLRQAESIFQKSVSLAPNNPAYLGEYGGACLLIADHEHSILYAIRGRDALEKVLTINPDSLKARDALMLFYSQAPWPLGRASRALAQAAEISRRDSSRGVQAYLRLVEIFERKEDFSAARDACKAALRFDPANPAAIAASARLAAH